MKKLAWIFVIIALIIYSILVGTWWVEGNHFEAHNTVQQ